VPAKKPEVAMSVINHPPKHLVREYLERRSHDPKPPPTPEEIRRQLGWGMLLQADLKMPTSRS
jgi:hypothetical protein